jgi:hypothetical protein
MTVRGVAVAALVAATHGSATGCAPGRTTKDEQSYVFVEHVSALIVDGQAAMVTVDAGEGAGQIST